MNKLIPKRKVLSEFFSRLNCWKYTLLTLTAFIFFTSATFAATFSDVSNDHPYYAAIESLKNLGIIDGYGDGTFGPDNPVNRAEALKIILGSAEIEIQEADESATEFTDVDPEAWFAKFVNAGRAKGIVAGNPDGTFAPARAVNKAEFLKMLLESFEIDLSHHQDQTTGISADTSARQWFLPYLSYAKTLGIISVTLDNKLFPGKELSRGESAEIIYKMLVLQRGGDAQKLLSIAESNLVELLVNLNNNNIQQALHYADNAIFYTNEVLLISPDDAIAKGAKAISEGFKYLCLAYQAGVEQRSEDLIKHVSAANNSADQASKHNISFTSLQAKISEMGDILLQQVE